MGGEEREAENHGYLELLRGVGKIKGLKRPREMQKRMPESERSRDNIKGQHQRTTSEKTSRDNTKGYHQGATSRDNTKGQHQGTAPMDNTKG